MRRERERERETAGEVWGREVKLARRRCDRRVEEFVEEGEKSMTAGRESVRRVETERDGRTDDTACRAPPFDLSELHAEKRLEYLSGKKSAGSSASDLEKQTRRSETFGRLQTRNGRRGDFDPALSASRLPLLFLTSNHDRRETFHPTCSHLAYQEGHRR